MSQIVGKFLRNFSGKVPIFPEISGKIPHEISQLTTLLWNKLGPRQYI